MEKESRVKFHKMFLTFYHSMSKESEQSEQT
jgi:hypothetical protein